MITRLRILIIDNSSRLTGAFKSILLATSAIPSCDFSFALPKNSSVSGDLKRRSIDVLQINFLEISKRALSLFYLPMLIWNSFKILNYVKKNDVSILHVNDVYNMCGVVVKILRPKIKLVYHVRLMPDSYVGKLYNYYIHQISKHADVIIAVSESVKEALNARKVNSIVVYDALSIDERYPAKIRKDESSSITLLYLANFISGKGHAFAIEAFAEARKQVSDLKMIMVGGDLGLRKNARFKTELERRVIELGLTNEISFHGYVEDVEKLMKTADIVLNFSESESFSLTSLEALSYGIPLIASDSGGPKELFENEKSGILIPNRDIEKMTMAIVRLSKSKKLRQNFAMEGRAFVLKKFDLAKTAQVLCSIYKQINQ